MVLYSAVSSPLDRSKRFTLSSPGRPVHSDTVLGFSWKHSSHAAIAQRLFTHISTTVYSRVLIYTAESTVSKYIRDSLQMELGIHGQHHHMPSVRRLMTTAGKFSGLANVVRKLLQQIDKQWYSSWITIVPDGCTGRLWITSVHWKNGNKLHI